MGAVVHQIQDEVSTELIFGFWQALILITILLTIFFGRSNGRSWPACRIWFRDRASRLFWRSLIRRSKPGVAIIFSIALGLAFNIHSLYFEPAQRINA